MAMKHRPTVPPPLFQIACVERVGIDGKDFLNHAVLFAAEVAATCQRIRGAFLVTCCLTPAQGETYWRALASRYMATQECAWVLRVGPLPPFMVIGFIAAMSLQQTVPDLVAYAVTFTPSGNSTVPYHRLDAPVPAM